MQLPVLLIQLRASSKRKSRNCVLKRERRTRGQYLLVTCQAKGTGPSSWHLHGTGWPWGSGFAWSCGTVVPGIPWSKEYFHLGPQSFCFNCLCLLQVKRLFQGVVSLSMPLTNPRLPITAEANSKRAGLFFLPNGRRATTQKPVSDTPKGKQKRARFIKI